MKQMDLKTQIAEYARTATDSQRRRAFEEIIAPKYAHEAVAAGLYVDMEVMTQDDLVQLAQILAPRSRTERLFGSDDESDA